MANLVVTPSQSDVFKAVVAFLRAILPDNTPTRQGQANRAPEPPAGDFIVYWLIMMPRLATNLDTFLDCVFTGEISGSVLTVSAVDPNSKTTLKVGSTVWGDGFEGSVRIIALGTGTGGVGTYTINASLSVASEKMAAGILNLEHDTDCQIQVDVHGPNSVNNAAIISTIFRDEKGVDLFAGTGLTPLYADDPRQVPFMNAEQQWEWRLVVTLHLQVNFVVPVPQQAADELHVTTIDVDAAYPPTV